MMSKHVIRLSFPRQCPRSALFQRFHAARGIDKGSPERGRVPREAKATCAAIGEPNLNAHDGVRRSPPIGVATIVGPARRSARGDCPANIVWLAKKWSRRRCRTRVNV